jgi:DNA-binding LacI/PurR family transcriptional regulator
VAVTIRDVARKAGVAKSVVSTVLSGRLTTTRVSEETRQRVYDAARELHYSPNALARGLARKRSDTFGIIPLWSGCLSVWSGFVSEMMQGVTVAAERERYGMLLNFMNVDYDEDEETAARQVAEITDGRIDGALLWRLPTDPLAQRLYERGFPVVMMFGSHNILDIPSADCDNVLGGRLATEYLLELGHTRILHLTGNQRERYVRDRIAGYEHALQNAGLPIRPEWIVDVGWEQSVDAPYTHVRRLLTGRERPTAVFAWYDGVACRMLQKAAEWGIRVPQELSIIGFDSTAQYAFTSPPLTSMRQPIQEIADCAATMLIRRIRGEPLESAHRLFIPSLNIRGSCAPPVQQSSV